MTPVDPGADPIEALRQIAADLASQVCLRRSRGGVMANRLRLRLALWLDPRPRMIWFARLDGKRAAVDSEGNVWVEAWRSGGCRECTRLVLEGDDRD